MTEPPVVVRIIAQSREKNARTGGKMTEMGEPALDQAAALLRGATRVAVLTGAGVSAESGVPTFRGGGGLWEGQPVERVATPEAFLDDPERVWRFYEQRRRNLLAVKPNPAHGVLARWQDQFPHYTLITQNVDGLHQAAGAREVLELHGNIWRIRCSGCGRERLEATVPLPELPPRCACGGIERPGVVWFGELLPEGAMERAAAAVSAADVLIIAGTSAVVMPAAGLGGIALRAGIPVIEINPEPTPFSEHTLWIPGKAGEVLPEIVAE
jgi:NAD-dependent deacetylase